MWNNLFDTLDRWTFSLDWPSPDIIVIRFFFFSHFFFPASGQAVVTGVVPSPPRFLPPIFIAHRVQQPHCSSTFHRVLQTHALALSASQVVRKKKSPRIYTSMHPGRFELTKLTCTKLEDNLIRHRGDRDDVQPYQYSVHINVRQQQHMYTCIRVDVCYNCSITSMIHE